MRFSQADNVCIDVFEYYQKQTYRNRATILTSQGRQDMSVPVRKYAPQTPFKDILIDNTQRWASIHFRTLVTAYRKSPFFEYYADTLEKIYEEKTDFLADFNKKLLTFCLNILKIKTNYFFSEKYFDINNFKENNQITENNVNEAIIYEDFRDKIGTNILSDFPQKEYLQVFGNGFEKETFTNQNLENQNIKPNVFQKNLSIIDLIFCEGKI